MGDPPWGPPKDPFRDPLFFCLCTCDRPRRTLGNPFGVSQGGDVGGWVRGGGRNLTERLATRIRRQGAEVLGQFHNLTRRGSLSPPWVQSSRRIFTPDHDSTSADFESR